MGTQLTRRPSFVVCLAAFNGIAWIPEQMNSICAQVEVDVTIFVSVDRSSDGTEQWIEHAATNDSRIQILPHGMYFGGAARNFFRLIRDIDFSSFDYVSFSDQDDIWMPDKLIRAHKSLLSTGCDAYSSNVIAFWPDGHQSLVEKSQPQVRWDFLFEAAGPGCTYVLSNGIACALQDQVKKQWDDVQQVGLHDWFSYAFARANGYRWTIDPVATMLYRQHSNNQYGVNVGWRAFFHRAKRVLSGWGLDQTRLVARLTGFSNGTHPTSHLNSGRFGLIRLAMNARQCRRRGRDKVFFALSCLLLCLKWRGKK